MSYSCLWRCMPRMQRQCAKLCCFNGTSAHGKVRTYQKWQICKRKHCKNRRTVNHMCDMTFTEKKKGKHNLIFGATEVKSVHTLALKELTGLTKITVALLAVWASCRYVLNWYHRCSCEVEWISTLVTSMSLLKTTTSDTIKGCDKSDLMADVKKWIMQECPCQTANAVNTSFVDYQQAERTQQAYLIAQSKCLSKPAIFSE